VSCKHKSLMPLPKGEKVAVDPAREALDYWWCSECLSLIATQRDQKREHHILGSGRDSIELDLLRDIARLAGEWGKVYVVLSIHPSKEAQKKAGEVAKNLAMALEAYEQLLREKN